MSTDEEFAKRLPSLLVDEPLGPSRVDIPRAIKTVRRGRKIRYTATGVLIAAVLSTIPLLIDREEAVPPAAPPRCTATASPDIKKILVDPSGKHLVGTTPDLVPAFWRPEGIERIALPDKRGGAFVSVNTSGTAVGNSHLVNESVSDDKHPFVYKDGKVSLLPGGQATLVTDISESGAIIGYPLTAPEGAPLIWRTPSSTPELLPLPPGASGGQALSFMDDGWIYGKIYNGSGLVPFRWPPHGPGKVVELPPGASDWTVSGTGHWIHGSYYPEDAFLTDVTTGLTRKITGIQLPEMSGLVTDDGRVAGSLNELPVLASVSDVEHLPLIGDFVGGDWSMRGVTPDGRLLIGQYYGDRKAKPYTDAAIVWRCAP